MNISLKGSQVMTKKIMANHLVILISAIFPFLAFWQMSLINVLGHVLSSKLNSIEMSYLSASYLYADGLFLIPVGLLLDRFSIKYIMILGIVIFSCGIMAFMLSNSFYEMCIARMIIGSGHAFALISCFKLVNLLIPDNRQTSWIGIVLMIAFCGGMAAQMPSLLISNYLGWYGLMGVTLGISILVGLCLLISIPNKIVETKNLQTNKNIFKNILIVFLNHKNWLCALFIGAMDIMVMILGSVFGFKFLQYKGLSVHLASIITSTIYIGSIVGSLILSHLFDRIKKKSNSIWLVSFIIFFLLFFAIHSESEQYWVYLFIFSLCGFLSSIRSIGYAKVAQLNSKNLVSTAMSVVNVVLMFSSAGLQIGFGYLYVNEGFRSFYLLIFLILVGGLVGALLCKLTNKNE